MSTPRKPRPKKGTAKPIRFDRKLVGDLLRANFHCCLAAQHLSSIGFSRSDDWLPFTLLDDMFWAYTGIDHDDMPFEWANELCNARYDYWYGFATVREFDPDPLMDWLEAGDYREHPFKGEPKGVWAKGEPSFDHPYE